MKQYIKLLFKCICVIFPLIVLCLYFRTHLLSFIDEEGPFYLWNKAFTNTTQEKHYDVIILGDSSANAAYVPEYLSDDTVNLALGGLSPVENYYTLKDWLDHNAPPKVCYISFFDSLLSLDGYFWTRAYYAHRYSLGENIEMIKTAFHYDEKTILKEHPLLDMISYELYLPNKYITPFLNASFNQRYDSNDAAVKAADLHGGRYIAQWITSGYDPVGVDSYASLVVNPIFDYYYRRMIDLCYENGITVRIIKLPLPETSVFGDGYEESFYSYYDALVQEYPGLTVDRFPLYPNDLFADNRHTNTHGALRFSAELKARYPQDFENDTLSEKRINAINDSIRMENRVPEIIQWIVNKDYTLAVNDGSGHFEEYYSNNVQNALLGGSVKVLRADEDSNLSGFNIDICYICGLDNESESISITQAETGLSIQLDSENVFPLELPPSGGLRLVVIDNYSDQVVCEKTFIYDGGEYVIY